MKKVVFILISLMVLGIIVSLSFYNMNLAPIMKSSKEVKLEIKQGDTYLSIASVLKKNNLIKNESVYKLYIKLNKPTNLEANTYLLNTNMGVKKIIENLEKGTSASVNLKMTFQEGKNMRHIIKVITQNTNNKEKDIINLLNDKTYLDSLIKEYWFLKDIVKNNKLYYSLEGYLFPDTYIFADKSVSTKQIFKSMLDRMNVELTKLKLSIDKSKYNIHELLTLASVVQTEGNNAKDWKTIAGVFYNRLDTSMKLGSCVTAYYGVKRDFGTGPLYQSEMDDINDYNTYVITGLPIGPIATISLNALNATIKPKQTDYYYFVSDINGKTYFAKNYEDHNQIIKELQYKGIWNG